MSSRTRFPYPFLLLALAAGWLADATPARAQGLEAFARARPLRVQALQDGAPAAPAPEIRGKPLALAQAEPGTITGTVRTEPEWLESAYVAAWPADTLAGDRADGVGEDGSEPAPPLAAVQVPVEPDGRYRLEVAPGAYYVSATAKEHETRYWQDAPDIASATVVEVPEAGVVESIDFTLERYGAGEGGIAGVVTTADGHPIANAVVHVFATDSHHFGMAETDADGRYQIVGLGAGNYVVEVWHPEYQSELYEDAATYEEATLVTVTEPGTTQGIDFGLATGGVVTGVVRDAAGEPVEGAYISVMRPWLRGGSEEPVEEVVVDGGPAGDLRSAGGWAVTGDDGRYRVGGLTSGDYWVQAQASHRWVYASVWYDGVQDPARATTVTVVLDQETGGIDLVLDLPVTESAIAGRITDDQGRPLAQAWVAVQDAASWAGADWTLHDEVGIAIGAPTPDGAVSEPAVVGMSRLWAGAVTDEDGRYSVDELPAGTYLVSASTSSGWEHVQRWYVDALTPTEATEISLADGARRADIDIVLPLRAATASLSGTVRDQEGHPLPGAFVEIGPMVAADGIDPEAGRTVWAYGHTDDEGAFRVDRLPAGTYSVHATYHDGENFGQRWYDGADEAAAATPVVLGEDEVRLGLDLQLEVRPIYGVVAGTVTDAATGAAFERAYVELTPVLPPDEDSRGARVLPLRIWAPWAVTDGTGAYRLGWIPEGRYAVAIYADGASGTCGGGPEPVVIDVVGGASVTCDAALQTRAAGDGAIAGRVHSDFDGPWFEGVRAEEPTVDASGDAVTTDAVAADAVRLAVPDIAVVTAFPIHGSGEAVATAVTRDDGSYELRGLAAGDYLLMCFGPSRIGTYYDGAYAPDRAEVVHVDDGGRVEGIDFRLEGLYYALAADGAEDVDTGAPTADRSGGVNAVVGQVLDQAGEPVARATVYLLDDTEQPVAFAQTAGDGSFELSGTGAGPYRVYAGKPGFAGVYNGNETSFGAAAPLTLDEGSTQVRLVLSPAGATAVEEETGADGALPREVALLPNIPNPFNPSTQIRFTVPTAGQATLRIYDVLGQQVAVAFDGPVEAGATYQVRFGGNDLAAGVYFYALEFDARRWSRPMLLVK